MNIADNKSVFVPYLESGDRLTRAEFERRYTAIPHGKKAELIFASTLPPYKSKSSLAKGRNFCDFGH